MSAGQTSVAETARRFGRVLPIKLFATTPAPPIDLLFQRLSLVAGTTGVIHAPGGAGKSMLTLEMCVALALAGLIRDWLDFGPIARADGEGWRVMYYTAEDPDAVIHHRVREIAGLWNLSGELCELLAQRLQIVSLYGSPRVKIDDEATVHQVIDDVGAAGTRLAVFDTLTRFHGKDEVDNTEMAAVIGQFDRIAYTTGAGVVVLHHAGKSAVLNGLGSTQQAARGASAILDNSRWGMSVSGTDVRGVVSVTETKHSYGAGSERYFAFTDRGVLSPCAPPGANGQVRQQAASVEDRWEPMR
jgi:RecA-family ATPase